MATLAAVDCGTNSVRLLVSNGQGRDRRVLDRRMTITRLGQGVDASGRLAPEAIGRTLDVLRGYRRVIDELGATEVTVAATAAARDAANAAELLEPLAALFGAAPRCLTGEEEGRLGFLGATAGLAPEQGPFLVVDIGGGSTECSVGTTEPVAVRSLPIGAVRLTERHLDGDPPEPEGLSNAIFEATEAYDELLRQVPEVLDVRTVIGVAGTITTVTAVEIGLLEWDDAAIHHFTLTKDAAEDVFRTLATETLADRIHNPGLDPARADVIVGGCCALVALYRTLGLDSILVSTTDILDGLLLDLADRTGG